MPTVFCCELSRLWGAAGFSDSLYASDTEVPCLEAFLCAIAGNTEDGAPLSARWIPMYHAGQLVCIDISPAGERNGRRAGPEGPAVGRAAIGQLARWQHCPARQTG